MSVQWWKDIPGYEGKYQASRVGEIRHIYPSGHVRILKPYIKKEQRSRRRLFVHLVKDGIVKEYQVFRLVAAAFAKSAPPGMVLYHINGEVTDNRVDNIGYITREKLGQITAAKAHKRKTVFKVDAEGKVIEVYSSARQAAKENYMSRQTVLNRCNGIVKDPFKWNDFTFRYEE